MINKVFDAMQETLINFGKAVSDATKEMQNNLNELRKAQGTSRIKTVVDTSKPHPININVVEMDKGQLVGYVEKEKGFLSKAMDGQKESIEEVWQDIINKPDHYHKGNIDIYEIMQAKLTPEEYRGFCKGNVLKYLLRADLKGKAVEDLKKLGFNNDRLLECYQGIKYVPEYKQEKKEIKELVSELDELLTMSDQQEVLNQIKKILE